VAATVGFHGRGCCVGEDQIVFTVPDNAPLGCNVPVAVQINDQVSNYVSIAIAAKGSRTCKAADPTLGGDLVTQLSTSPGPFTYGQVELHKEAHYDNGAFTGNTDFADAFSPEVHPSPQPTAVLRIVPGSTRCEQLHRIQYAAAPRPRATTF